MIYVLIVLLIINLALACANYLHMFQLNFYKTNMHLHWCKSNIGKLIFRSVLSLCGLLVLTEPLILQVFAAIVLAFSIFLLIPKKKSKVPFKITGRVLRLFALEAVITALIVSIKPSLNCTIIRLGIINVLAPFLCLVANFVLYPIEKVGQKRYIDSAKAILEKHQDLTIIGITGSYGKTSMKTFLNELLKQKYNVLTTPQNYNTPLGIAKTIKTELKPTHQIFVCEMGAMWKGEIAECCELANPDLGIITAIGPQHLQTFKTIDTIISTKFELADSVAKNDGVVFLDCDNQYIKKHHTKANVISYGVENEKLDYYADKLKSSSEGQRFTINHEGKKLECQVKLLGFHNTENLTGAIAVAKYLGVSDKDIQYALKHIKGAPHRLELSNRGNLSIIDDTYNSNPVSSKLAVDTLSELEGKQVVITPGLIELGDDEERYNQELGEHIAKQEIDHVYLVGRGSQTAAIEAGLTAKKFDEGKIQYVKSPQEGVSYATRRYPSEKLNILLLNDLPDNYN